MALKIIEIPQFSMQIYRSEINHTNVPSSFYPNASKCSLLSQMYCYSEQHNTQFATIWKMHVLCMCDLKVSESHLAGSTTKINFTVITQ